MTTVRLLELTLLGVTWVIIDIGLRLAGIPFPFRIILGFLYGINFHNMLEVLLNLFK